MSKLVYLVEDCGNAPGRVYGVFAVEQDALDYGNVVEAVQHTACEVSARHVQQGAIRFPSGCVLP